MRVVEQGVRSSQFAAHMAPLPMTKRVCGFVTSSRSCVGAVAQRVYRTRTRLGCRECAGNVADSAQAGMARRPSSYFQWSCGSSNDHGNLGQQSSLNLHFLCKARTARSASRSSENWTCAQRKPRTSAAQHRTPTAEAAQQHGMGCRMPFARLWNDSVTQVQRDLGDPSTPPCPPLGSTTLPTANIARGGFRLRSCVVTNYVLAQCLCLQCNPQSGLV